MNLFCVEVAIINISTRDLAFFFFFFGVILYILFGKLKIWPSCCSCSLRSISFYPPHISGRTPESSPSCNDNRSRSMPDRMIWCSRGCLGRSRHRCLSVQQRGGAEGPLRGQRGSSKQPWLENRDH